MDNFICNLLVPGAAKSGTSTLHYLLNQHPRIRMSRPKEPHFFAIDENFSCGPEDHNSLFEQGPDTSYYGESSTLYMPSEKAISRIEQSLKNPRIIFLLRDPIQRCMSHYFWMYRLGYETRSPRQAFELDEYDLDPDKHYGGNFKSYLQFSRYSHYIPKWSTTFGEQNVLVLRTEDLKQDYQSVMNRYFEFLDVESCPVQEASLNRTDGAVRVVVPDWVRWFERRSSERVRRFLRYGRVKRGILRRMTHDAPWDLDESLRVWLQKQLADDIAFFQKIGTA